MDYSVGSLSDLITGKNTPNKKEVVTKQVLLKNNSPITNESPDTEEEEGYVSDINHPKKERKAKSIDSKTKTSKKRKLIDNTEDEPKPKKTRNSENAEKRVARKEKEKKLMDDQETLARTILVGNLPITSNKRKIGKIFKQYGKIESIRIRGVPVANPKIPKKVAIIKKEFHPERNSFYSYIKFENREDAIKALASNGQIYEDHHLRVHLCVDENKRDESKAIFVGNLSFYAEEEDLWKIFEPCGPIESVRIVRDGRTGIGKGFGYVNFQNSDSVTLALEMEDVKLKERELRIKICNIGGAKNSKKSGTFKKKPRKSRMLKQTTENEGDVNVDERNKEKTTNKSFQGVTSDKKKKHKVNKGLIQKKRLIKKIAPK